MDDYFLGVEARQGFIARADVLSCGFDDRFIRRQLASKAWTQGPQGRLLLHVTRGSPSTTSSVIDGSHVPCSTRTVTRSP